MSSWIMFTAGILLMTIILVRRSMRYYRKRAIPSSPSPSIRKLESKAGDALYDAPKEVLRWQVEMHEMARDLKAELDTKMRSLQILIRMADEATERLQQTIERVT